MYVAFRWWKEQKNKRRKKHDVIDGNTISAVRPTQKSETIPAHAFTSKRGFRSFVDGSSTKSTKPNTDNVRERPVTSASAVHSSSDDSSCDEGLKITGHVSETTQTSTHSDIHLKQSHEEKTKQSTSKLKRRYILFLGNLSPASTHEDILSHFVKRGVPIKGLRLLTHKDTGKSRGCAFAEFESDRVLKNALKFHRSKLNGKTINIEVTCGGGGKGKSRKTKIMSKNKRQRSDRARKSTT